MKIGIDGRPFKYIEYSGIPNTIYEVIKNWMKQHPEHEYYLISNADIQLKEELPDNWHKVVSPGITGNGTLWYIFHLRSLLIKLKLDAYWGDNYLLPGKIKDCCYLMSVYDLSFAKYPHTSSRKTRLILKFFLKKSCKRANVIHAISDATKEDLHTLYKVSENKIHRIYLGAPEIQYRNCRQSERLQHELGKSSFFLFLSTLEPRKNPNLVLDAYQLFCEQHGESIHLVFAGKKGWVDHSFYQKLEHHPYRRNIHFLGYIDEEEKAFLLQNAKALVYPSIYEGFGLPILEAMQSGTPVITSNVSSMPEIGGNVAFYLRDKGTAAELADLMHEVCTLTDEMLMQLRNQMKDNCERFSWKECSEQILKLLSGE